MFIKKKQNVTAAFKIWGVLIIFKIFLSFICP